MAQVACAAVQSVKSFIARRVVEKSSHATSNLDEQDQDARAEDDESTNTAPLMPIFVHAAKLSSFYRQRKPESSINNLEQLIKSYMLEEERTKKIVRKEELCTKDRKQWQDCYRTF